MQLAHRGQAPAKGRITIGQHEPLKLDANGKFVGDANGFRQGYHAASQERRARRFALRILGRRQVLKTAKYEKRNGPI